MTELLPESECEGCLQCGSKIPPHAPNGLCRRCLYSGLAADLERTKPQSSSDEDACPRLGDYDLVKKIASGGMGVVFKARQRSLGRWVAVKVISGGIGVPGDFFTRFRAEAETAAALDHPNIVPVHEVGETGGQLYFSMKLIEGGTLSSKPRTPPFPVRAAVAVILKIARAVHYAHQRGVLHRDIKPNNILIDAAGEPYLTDFGIAKLVEHDRALTQTNAVLGTPSYMSPEQARGESRFLTTAADVYGLGAVLYDQITGQPPFASGTTMETVRLVLDTETRRPSALNSEVDRDLETICLKCLEKDPSHRYRSADALADELERWLRNEPILARPASPLDTLLKWVRRKPTIAALSALVTVASIAIVVVSTVLTLRLRQSRSEVAEQAKANRLGAVRLLVSEATRSVEDGDHYRALLPLTEALRHDAGSLEPELIQRRQIGTVLRQCPRLQQLWLHGGAVQHTTLSSDERRVAVAAADGMASVWDLESGARIGAPLVHTSRVAQVVFSPDGRRAATLIQQGLVQVWDLDSGQKLGVPIPHRMQFRERILFAPDGDQLFVPGPSTASVWRLNPSPEPLFTFEAAGLVHAIAVNRDGSLWVTGGPDHLARIWDRTKGWQISATLRHPATVQLAFFTADDHLLVTLARDRIVRVWDATTGELLRSTEPAASADIMNCAASRDGRWIATAGFDNVARLWDATHSGPALAVFPHQGGVDSVQFSQDGSWLVTGSFDGSARRWDRATGRPLPPIFRHTSSVSSVHPVENDRGLITAGLGGDVRLWRLTVNDGAKSVWPLPDTTVFVTFTQSGSAVLAATEGGELRQWPLLENDSPTRWTVNHGGPVSAAALSQDGRMVATGGVDGQVQLWETGQPSPRFTLPAPADWKPWSYFNSGRVSWIAFSPDASRLAVSSMDGSVFLWDVLTAPKLVARLQHADAVLSTHFSPDNHWLVSGDFSGIVRLWDAGNGRLSRELRPMKSAVSKVQFSPDGKQLVTAHWDYSNDGLAARRWNPTDGTELPNPMFHRDGTLTARFSHLGRHVVTGGEDNQARVWDAISGQPTTPFLSHRGFITETAFSTDDRLIATGSRDGTARVWNVSDGQQVTPPLRHGAAVTHVEFSPDGHWLLTASIDRTVRLWDVSPISWPLVDLTAAAELLAGHRLDSNRELSPLSMAEMRQRWERLRVTHPEYWLGEF